MSNETPAIHLPEKPHSLPSEQVLQSLGTSQEGLSVEEATHRLAKYGENTLQSGHVTPAWVRFARQFKNVLIYVLIVSAGISMLLGHWLDGGVILGVVLINAIVGFVQEGKAESALRAILNLARSNCLVYRGGNQISIDSQSLVPGDIVSLQAGDKIPADLRIIYCKDLRCDESSLTGESQPVGKRESPVEAEAVLAERKNMAYMGTMATYGVARGVVCRTGQATEIGQINTLVQQAVLPVTPLQKQLAAFAKQLSIGIVFLSLAAMLFGMFVHDFSFGEMFQAAIGIAVASIPEGLPAIVTITLAIGVQRMAQNKALVRRLPCVEVLGSVDVICSDKTGTLTTNAMTARALVTAESAYKVSGEGYRPEGGFHAINDGDVPLEANPLVNQAALIALLCNDASLSHEGNDWHLNGDPTEGALLIMAMKHGLASGETKRLWPRIDEIPFETQKRYMATLHHNTDGEKLLAIKGAPDRILNYCTKQRGVKGVEPIDAQYWQTELEKVAVAGMRVMALAERSWNDADHSLSHALVEGELTIVALVGISDPPRQEAISSIHACNQAGIRVKMITGDSPVTARAIGRELGLNADNALTGAELDSMTPEALADAAEKSDIFARTSPANKLQLVQALQSRGHIVSMTGDGVNDAPALKTADIGVAMGKKGTDAAKEASDIVLTDDNFSTIAKAVEEGRTVYDNIVKSILFILPTNLAEACVIIFAILAGRMLPITPAQILWVNMVTAVTLALALAFERSEGSVMQRPPRAPNQGLITPTLLIRLLIVGLGAAFLIFWQFSNYRNAGADLELSRTMAVNTLVMIEAFYLLNCRSLTHSVFSARQLHNLLPSLSAILGVLCVQLAFTYLPVSQATFGVSSLSVADWLNVILFSLPVLFVVEIERVVQYRLRTPFMLQEKEQT